MSVTLLSPMPLGSTIARRGLVDEDVAVGVVALGTAPSFIGLPTSPLVRLFSLPRPGRLSPSSSSASVLDVEVMNRARIWSAAERGLLHEVARGPRRRCAVPAGTGPPRGCVSVWLAAAAAFGGAAEIRHGTRDDRVRALVDRAALRLSLVVDLEAETAMEEKRRTRRRCHGFQRLAGGEERSGTCTKPGAESNRTTLPACRGTAVRPSGVVHRPQNRLGVMYRDGVGVAGDDEAATAWLCGRSGCRWHGGGLNRMRRLPTQAGGQTRILRGEPFGLAAPDACTYESLFS